MRRIFCSFLSVLLLSLFLTTNVFAQEPLPVSPPLPPGPAGSLQRTADGVWYSTGESDVSEQRSLPQANGGPDEFGYLWSDGNLNWVDASGGIDPGISPSNNHSGPIEIGFPFKYYENTYSSLYISLYGFVTLKDTSSWWRWQSDVPAPYEPNDVIAPHWVPIDRIAH